MPNLPMLSIPCIRYLMVNHEEHSLILIWGQFYKIFLRLAENLTFNFTFFQLRLPNLWPKNDLKFAKSVCCSPNAVCNLPVTIRQKKALNFLGEKAAQKCWWNRSLVSVQFNDVICHPKLVSLWSTLLIPFSRLILVYQRTNFDW